ncbi:MAG: pilus assembly protein CpaE [Pseudomonadota bacterium]|nr:pilus assembly protein CpaE [Pseudomonadota bacterium]
MTAFTKTQILLAGRSSQDIVPLASALNVDFDNHISTHIISNGHADPLYGLNALPDILILWLSAQWEDELHAFASRRPALRPPTIIISLHDDPEILRLALRSGARDFLTHPAALHELKQAIQRIIQEKHSSLESSQQTIAVLNAKGGSGGTVIASNLAHIMAVRQRIPVALLDLDIQFGSQALSLDLHPTRDIVEALNASGQLDAVALEGYMTKHKSGLNLLAAPLNRLVLPGEIVPEHLDRLLEVVHQTYTRVVIDLPRLIDAVSTVVLAQVTTVVVVMQQALASMRDARRLIEILQREIEIPKERIVVVINRYNPKHPITLDAIRQTLQQSSITLIPSDYARFEIATNQGMPLLDFAPRAPITQTLVELAQRVGGETEAPAKRGLLSRALGLLAGSKPEPATPRPQETFG